MRARGEGRGARGGRARRGLTRQDEDDDHGEDVRGFGQHPRGVQRHVRPRELPDGLADQLVEGGAPGSRHTRRACHETDVEERGGRDEQGVRHRAARARRPGGAAADPTAPGRSTGVGRGKAPGAGEMCVSPEPRMHTRVSHARLREAVSTASRVRPGGACAAPFRPPPSPRPPFFHVCDEPTPVVRSKCQLKETKSLLAH